MLHLIQSANPADGGPSEVLRQLCLCHAQASTPVEVVTLDPPGAPWLAHWPVPVHALDGLGRYGWTRRLPDWLRREHHRFSSAFIHGLWQWTGLGTTQALRETTTPYFVFPHGMLDPWFRAASPLRHLRKAIYWRLFEQRVIRDAAGIIFTAEEERTRGRETFSPWRTRGEVVLPLGVPQPPPSAPDLQERFYERFPKLRGERLLLFLGRLHEKKGCDLLLEAFRRIAPPLHLVLAGPCASPTLARQLEAQAQGLPVTFTGPLWDTDKQAALAAAEAFILPSHQENFGIAVVEALAAGLPVLISDKVNIWREVTADGAGLAEADTVDGTARLLKRWLEADAPAMRLAARRCFAARFDIRQTAAALVKLAAESFP